MGLGLGLCTVLSSLLSGRGEEGFKGVAVWGLNYLPLVSREWKNGGSSNNCTPFLHSLLTKGKIRVQRFMGSYK